MRRVWPHCTCPNECHAGKHLRQKKKSIDPLNFIDSTGRLIKTGDKLLYVNPHHPEKTQPIHIAVIRENDCSLCLPDGTHMNIRHHNWNASRFTIIS